MDCTAFRERETESVGSPRALQAVTQALLEGEGEIAKPLRHSPHMKRLAGPLQESSVYVFAYDDVIDAYHVRYRTSSRSPRSVRTL